MRWERIISLADGSQPELEAGGGFPASIPRLEIHLIELPKFRKVLAELETDLDFWLYFLKNGDELDADA